MLVVGCILWKKYNDIHHECYISCRKRFVDLYKPFPAGSIAFVEVHNPFPARSTAFVNPYKGLPARSPRLVGLSRGQPPRNRQFAKLRYPVPAQKPARVAAGTASAGVRFAVEPLVVYGRLPGQRHGAGAGETDTPGACNYFRRPCNAARGQSIYSL